MHWFELMPIELGRFDPDSQALDFIPNQFIWNLDISDTVHFLRKTISQLMQQRTLSVGTLL